MKIIEVIILSTLCSTITAFGIFTVWQFGWDSDNMFVDFWKNLLLVVIPVLITVYASKTIVNSWQIQKEKSEIRKNLLVEFDEGYSQLGQFMFELFYKIRYSYVDQSKIKFGSVLTVEEGIDFPTDVNQQPLAKFKDDILGLLESFSKSNTAQTKFLSSVILYFDKASDIMKECDKSNTHGKDLNVLLHQIIHSTNKKDFVSSCKLFGEINQKMIQRNNFIRIMIVYEKMKNPEDGMNPEFVEGFKTSIAQIESSSQDKTLLNSEP